MTTQCFSAPDFYPDFVALGCVQSMLGLLSHENTDISVAVVDLLQEMTDADNLSGLKTPIHNFIPLYFLVNKNH